MDYVFITGISRLAANCREISYNQGRITAAQTSEACCKYLLSRGLRPRLIIALCTKEAVTTTYQTENGRVTVRSYDHFVQAITDYCREKDIAVPAFRPVKILRRYERANHFGEAIHAVHKIIREEAMPRNTKILIDTAGGMRNISIMMQTMTRVLQYYGYQTAAYYTNYGERRVFCDHTDRQLAIMEALAEFTQHGTVNRLRACFSGNRIREIDNLLCAMQSFADSIQLCRTQALPAIINEQIFPALDRIDALNGASISQEDVAALRQMTDFIRIQFGFDPWMPAREITTVDLISWCLKNEMIQQAVTLFTENIPKYLVQNGMLQTRHYSRSRPGMESSWLYTLVIESCATTARSLEEQIFEETVSVLRGEGISDNPKTKSIKYAIDKFSRFCAGRKPSEAMVYFRAGNQIESELLTFVLNSTGDTMDEVKTQLIEEKLLLQKLLGTKKEKIPEAVRQVYELRRKISGIEHFTPEGLHEKQPTFQICLRDGGTEAFKAFLMYYVYLKKFVRNKLNHAAEDETDITEFLSVFQTYGIITDELTPTNILENLNTALRHLNAAARIG